MAQINNDAQAVPVKIVGGSVFGRYPLISSERTYNMYVSDNYLIDFAGWKQALTTPGSIQGRGFYFSEKGGFIIWVKGASVYRVDHINNTPTFLFTIGSSTGFVSIADNLSSQVAIVGGGECWVYNYVDNVFGQPTLNPDLVPGYVAYHDTHFVFGNASTAQNGSYWFIYNTAAGFELAYVQQLPIQTKASFAQAVVPIPGLGSNVMVFGQVVAEYWQERGGVQDYFKNASSNSDYGVVSIETIAVNDRMVCWLAVNQSSAPVIMVSHGGQTERISTDGIDYLLDSVNHPEQSYASFYRQDGHLFYLLSFYNEADNFSIMYDFNTKMFYDLTDWDFGVFPGRQLVYFEGQQYFIHFKNGNIYEMGSDLTFIQQDDDTTYEIPRIRTCDTQMTPDAEPFSVDYFNFILETGTQPISAELPGPPRIDIRISGTGGVTFSNIVPFELPPTAHFFSRPHLTNLGRFNRFTVQLRFWSKWRFVMGNGVVGLRRS